MIATLLLLGGVVVTVPERAQVKGLEIKVAAIAEVACDDPALRKRIEAASLGYAPAPGYHRILRADMIKFDLRRALPGIEVEIVGADRCRVDPVTQVLDNERLWALGMEKVEQLFEGTDASVRRAGDLDVIEVPAGERGIELRTALVESQVEAGPKTAAVQVLIDDELYRTIHVPFNVSLREPRWVLKHSVATGQVLDPTMFELRRIEVSFDTAQHGLPVEQLVGTVAVRPLVASSVVTERDIQRPVVVMRQEIVTVIVRSGGIEARDMGVAINEARVGENVRVKLNSTQREVTGRANANGDVEIILR